MAVTSELKSCWIAGIQSQITRHELDEWRRSFARWLPISPIRPLAQRSIQIDTQLS
jgi:hypothetical protein